MRWWDLPAAHRIETEIFPDPWSVEAFWSELAHVPETRHYLVAEQDGAVVGYAGLVCTGAQADVQTVAVAAGQQDRAVVVQVGELGCRRDRDPRCHGSDPRRSRSTCASVPPGR